MNRDAKGDDPAEGPASTIDGDVKPKCAGAPDSDCPYEPIYTCKQCGKPICGKHAEEFTADIQGKYWHEYDGYYCPTCIGDVAETYEYVRQEMVKQERSNLVCNFLGELTGCCNT